MIDEMLPKIRHKKPAITVILVTFGALSGWMLFGRSMLAQLQSLEKDRAAFTQKTTLAQSIGDFEQKLLDYQNKLTQGKKKGWFLEEMNSIARDSGFTILSVEPQQRRDLGNDLELISVHVEADASFHELGEFVSRIESAKSLLKVVQVEIEAVTDPANGGGGYVPAPTEMRRTENIKNKLYNISLTVGVLGPMRALVS